MVYGGGLATSYFNIFNDIHIVANCPNAYNHFFKFKIVINLKLAKLVTLGNSIILIIYIQFV